MVSPAARKTLTIQETAETSLNVHYMTAYRYIRQGQLPASRQGTQWLVRQADLDAIAKSFRCLRSDVPVTLTWINGTA